MHAKRTGGFAAVARTCPVPAARNGSDSSHGRVREIPAAPRRNVRRETDWLQEKASPAFMVTCLTSIRSVCNGHVLGRLREFSELNFGRNLPFPSRARCASLNPRSLAGPVPEGHLIIAPRFTAGTTTSVARAPQKRLKN